MSFKRATLCYAQRHTKYMCGYAHSIGDIDIDEAYRYMEHLRRYEHISTQTCRFGSSCVMVDICWNKHIDEDVAREGARRTRINRYIREQIDHCKWGIKMALDYKRRRQMQKSDIVVGLQQTQIANDDTKKEKKILKSTDVPSSGTLISPMSSASSPTNDKRFSIWDKYDKEDRRIRYRSRSRNRGRGHDKEYTRDKEHIRHRSRSRDRERSRSHNRERSRSRDRERVRGRNKYSRESDARYESDLKYGNRLCSDQYDGSVVAKVIDITTKHDKRTDKERVADIKSVEKLSNSKPPVESIRYMGIIAHTETAARICVEPTFQEQSAQQYHQQQYHQQQYHQQQYHQQQYITQPQPSHQQPLYQQPLYQQTRYQQSTYTPIETGDQTHPSHHMAYTQQYQNPYYNYVEGVPAHVVYMYNPQQYYTQSPASGGAGTYAGYTQTPQTPHTQAHHTQAHHTQAHHT
jgi:hypothetical protein